MAASAIERDRYTRRELALLAGLTVLALVSRVWGIWLGGIVGDEYYTVAHAAERVRGIQPAYYVLVVGSTQLLGDAPWVARLPAALLGTLAVPIFYWGFREILGRYAAGIGSLLVVLSEWHLYHSQMARFYSGVFLFALLSYVCFYRALQRDSYGWLGAALVANGLVVLFHATAVLVPVACFVFALMLLWWKPAHEGLFSLRVARTYALIGGAVGLALSPFFWHIARLWEGKRGSALDLSEPLEMGMQLVLNSGLLVVVAAGLGVWHLLARDRERGLFFMVGVLVPVLSLVLMAVPLSPVRAKYVIGVFPLLIALAACLASAAREAAGRSEWHAVAHAVSILLIVSMLPGFVSHYTGKYSLDVLDAVKAIEERWQPGDRIVVFSHSLGYHLEGRFPEDALVVRGGKGVWRSTLTPYQAGAPRAWVLVDTYRNQRYDTGVFAWLLDHAALAWRRYEWRLDYQQMGFELYRVGR